jgi:hypothetical protein
MRCKWLTIKPLERTGDNGLKIRVSAVRFCPWPPQISLTLHYLQSGCAVTFRVAGVDRCD